MARRRIPLSHPGEILKEEFLEPLVLTQRGLAAAIHLSQRQVGEIVQGKRAVTGDVALRLGRYFGTSPKFWLNMQKHYELELARDAAGATIEEAIAPLRR